MTCRRSSLLHAVATLGLLAASTFPARAADYKFLDDNAEPMSDIAFTAVPAATGQLTLVFDYKDDKNFYSLLLQPKSVSLSATINSSTRELASAPVRITPGSVVTLQRRPWAMQVIIDRRVALTAYDATFTSGKIGSTGTGGWALKDARLQPMEELYFSDDFTRADLAQNTDWKQNGGVWKLTAASPAVTVANREMSANPFSYQVEAGPNLAFASTGRWFWDNYEAQVSVKPQAHGMVGLAAYVQDDKNYLAFQWHAGEGPSARELVRVVDGKATVLARAPGAFLPRQWYRLGLRLSPGFVEAFIDGEPVFQAPNTWFGQGGIALLAQNASAVNFDDAHVQAYPFYDLDFTTGGAWTAQHGQWHAANSVLSSTSTPSEKGATRFLLTGRSDWNRYQMSAAARTGATGAAGLVVGYRSEADYAVFRWAGPQSPLPYHGRQQLMRFRSGQAKIVSDQPLHLTTRPDGFAPVKVDLAPGAFTVYNGADIVAQMTDESLSAGRPALWSQGTAAVAFRDTNLSFPTDAAAPAVAPRMATDALMIQYGWASASGEWLPQDGSAGQEFWNNGEFFGDGSLEFKWVPSTSANGKLELALRATRGKFDSGLVVRCEDQGDKGFQLTLLRAGQVLKQRQFELKPGTNGKRESFPVRVELEGRALLLTMAGQPALSYLDPSRAADNATSGTAIAARATGFTLNPNNLRALSAHRADYTFTDAPTDWYSPQGNWGVTSRWPCTADWTFFGARGTIPVLWHKRTFKGDIVVEAYVHNMMDQATPPYYLKPGNLNLTIGGDGKNPTSGYSFIYAGWHNTKSAILRGTKVVAENHGDKSFYSEPTVKPGYIFHRGWQYVRAEVRRTRRDGHDGVLVTFSVDKNPLGEYFDPTPLESWKQGGRIAFWTCNSSMSLARVKIESGANGPHTLPAGLLDITVPEPAAASKPLVQPVALGASYLEPHPATDSDGLATAIVERAADAGDTPSWTVRDPAAGGLFQVHLEKPGDNADKPSTWQVTPASHLGLDLAIPAETKIDLYVTIDSVHHLINLSGIPLSDTGKYDGDVRVLGDVNKTVEEKGWRHIDFDLGAALHRLYPNAASWKLNDISLGVLHGDDYRWAGFDGNPLGATYRLRAPQLTDDGKAPVTAQAVDTGKLTDLEKLVPAQPDGKLINF